LFIVALIGIATISTSARNELSMVNNSKQSFLIAGYGYDTICGIGCITMLASDKQNWDGSDSSHNGKHIGAIVAILGQALLLSLGAYCQMIMTRFRQVLLNNVSVTRVVSAAAASSPSQSSSHHPHHRNGAASGGGGGGGGGEDSAQLLGSPNGNNKNSSSSGGHVHNFKNPTSSNSINVVIGHAAKGHSHGHGSSSDAAAPLPLQ
jgi:hypothetical protein